MKIAVCIPAYKVKSHIVETVSTLPEEVEVIYVVDDRCPEQSGQHLKDNCQDPRVRVLFHEENKGVGGAMVTAYKELLKEQKANIAIKMDGDGQMDPKLIPTLIQPILDDKADYVKGNRFFQIGGLAEMPKIRLFGNSMLSLINKFVNGHWHIMDPTNGYTAIHTDVLRSVELDKIDQRYFFESDMLFRLGIIKARVKDMPMEAKYEDEESSLSISRVLFSFPPKYINRFLKRIFYCYFLRDFNAGTIQLFSGVILFLFGVIFGGLNWLESIQLNQEASAGTIMLAALPTILGFQLLLGFLNYDIQNNN